MSGKAVETGSGKYFAFISYSHADEKWGRWLHRRLERYRTPSRLAGSDGRDGKVARRIFPVFRDREELPTSSDLGATIQRALEDSRYLIVICSPRSAASHWVNEEVLSFKRLGRGNRILCLIVDGEPGATDKPGREGEECFPPAVRFKLGEAGALTDILEEPIAADARPGKDGPGNAFLKLAAGVLGVDYDALKLRDAARRRKARLAWAGACVAVVIAAGAGYKSVRDAQWERLRQQSIAIAAEAQEALDRKDTRLGLGRAIAAMPKDIGNPDRPLVPQATAALRRAITAHRALGTLRIEGAELPERLAVLPSGNIVLMESLGKAHVFDGSTGKLIRKYEPSVPNTTWALSKDNAVLYRAEHGPDTQRDDQTWFAPLTFRDISLETGDVKRELTVETSGVQRNWSTLASDGRFLVADTFRDGRTTLKIWDRTTGERHDIHTPDYHFISEAQIRPDGTVLMIAGPPERSEKEVKASGQNGVFLPAAGAFLLDVEKRAIKVVRDPSAPVQCPSIADFNRFLPPMPYLSEGPAPLPPPGFAFGSQKKVGVKMSADGKFLYALPPGVQGYHCLMRWPVDTPGAPQTAFELVNAAQIIQVWPQLKSVFEDRGFQPPKVYQKWYRELYGNGFGKRKNIPDTVSADGTRTYRLDRSGAVTLTDSAPRHTALPVEHPRQAKFNHRTGTLSFLHGTKPIKVSVFKTGAVIPSATVEIPTTQYANYQIAGTAETIATFAWERAKFNADPVTSNTVRLHSLKDGAVLATFSDLLSLSGNQPLFSPDDALATVVTRDGAAVLFDAATGKQKARLRVPGYQVVDAGFLGNNLVTLASNSPDDPYKRNVILARFKDEEFKPEILHQWKAQGGTLTASPKGGRLYVHLDVPAKDNGIEVIVDNASTAQIVLETPSGGTREAVFSPDEQYLVLAPTTEPIKIFNAATGAVDATGPIQKLGSYAPRLDPAGRYAVATPDSKLALLPLGGGGPPCSILNDTKADALAISPTGRHIAVFDSWEDLLTVFDMEACAPAAQFKAAYVGPFGLAFVGDDAIIAIEEGDDETRIAKRLPLYADPVRALQRARALMAASVFGQRQQ